MHADVLQSLAEQAERSAEWRRAKALQYPDDERNLWSANALDAAAAEIRSTSPDDPRIRVIAQCWGSEDASELLVMQLDDLIGRHGFDRLPGPVTPLLNKIANAARDCLRQSDPYTSELDSLRVYQAQTAGRAEAVRNAAAQVIAPDAARALNGLAALLDGFNQTLSAALDAAPPGDGAPA